MVEYLDPEIAGEGQSANNFVPGMAWTNAPAVDGEEWQPDIEPPRINDYAAMKKHKHYGRYFRPWRYVPFPAWLYHPTLDAKIVNTADDAKALVAADPKWRREPYHVKIDMTGKSLPVKSDTQRLAETIAAQTKGQAIDPGLIATIVASVMAALGKVSAPPAAPALSAEALMPQPAQVDDPIDREAMLQLAAERGIVVDKRWRNERLKKELGLD